MMIPTHVTCGLVGLKKKNLTMTTSVLLRFGPHFYEFYFVGCPTNSWAPGPISNSGGILIVQGPTIDESTGIYLHDTGLL